LEIDSEKVEKIEIR